MLDKTMFIADDGKNMCRSIFSAAISSNSSMFLTISNLDPYPGSPIILIVFLKYDQNIAVMASSAGSIYTFIMIV